MIFDIYLHAEVWVYHQTCSPAARLWMDFALEMVCAADRLPFRDTREVSGFPDLWETEVSGHPDEPVPTQILIGYLWPMDRSQMYGFHYVGMYQPSHPQAADERLRACNLTQAHLDGRF
ncbi:MAG: hypothetical protein D6722_03890 [Bacteroidetes bacterium]|nr:MAG: hypothetical protein D6722_03890 [Bacteroidota bacterium]